MKKPLLILFILASISAKPQQFEYKVLFEGIGDNREFFNDYGFPQTIFGPRLAFETGVKYGNHMVMGGLSYFFEFGSEIGALKPKPILYYQFQDEQKSFLFGAFPRRDKIDFPLAMLTDTLLYYRPNIEGMYGNIKWDWGRQNAFIDWVSRQTDVKREIFTAGTSGEISTGSVFLHNYFLMTHVAKPAIDIPDDHIQDFLGFALLPGIRTNHSQNFNGYLKAGILNSTYRKRNVTNGFEPVTTLYAEANGKYKNYGLKSVLHSGGGHKFAYGDHFYRARNYWRTDAIWYFINHEKVKGTFSFSFHIIDWEELNVQQQLSVIYVIGK